MTFFIVYLFFHPISDEFSVHQKKKKRGEEGKKKGRKRESEEGQVSDIPRRR